MTTKVFVGNLAFQTTDQALAEAFQDCGRVKSGVVITRGRRSLGYGFVEFESPDSALEAVKSKNNSQLKGRTLKVELASDNPIRSSDRMENRPPGPPPASSSSPSDPNSSGQPGGQRVRRRRNNRRRGRTGNKPSGPESSSPPPNPSSAPKERPERPGGGGENRVSRRRRNGPPPSEDRVLSKTAVFVANLPFGVKDEELLQFFKDNNAKSAHVVVTRNGRSRGYGFVDFEFEKDQQNAIGTKHNVKFTDRVITVTPSYKTQEIAPEN
jgi:RNA recognition motif-containing protein